MKTLVEKWMKSQEHSFIIKTYNIGKPTVDPQDVMMRMHDEYEITVLLNCTGKRFIGNTIENFSDIDLFMIGPHVPHSIQLDHYQKGEAITIHFLKDGFGSGFFDLPENDAISQLLHEANLGISFSQKRSIGFLKTIRRLFKLDPFERMVTFFRLLKELAIHEEKRILSSRGFAPIINPKDYQMVNQTYEYIINNFEDSTINLTEISEQANMAPATFCRYFKKHFHKTFTNFLNEVRIGHACKMLQSTNKNIAEIAFASGYNQLTNFNRQFKKIMGYSPKVYRRELNHNGISLEAS